MGVILFNKFLVDNFLVFWYKYRIHFLCTYCFTCFGGIAKFLDDDDQQFL